MNNYDYITKQSSISLITNIEGKHGTGHVRLHIRAQRCAGQLPTTLDFSDWQYWHCGLSITRPRQNSYSRSFGNLVGQGKCKTREDVFAKFEDLKKKYFKTETDPTWKIIEKQKNSSNKFDSEINFLESRLAALKQLRAQARLLEQDDD